MCVCGEGCIDHNFFEQIISLENLFSAWNEFKKGKKRKRDVQQFAVNLEDNLFALHIRLKNNTYHHSHYSSFYLHDPKLRHIHKPAVQDRILHHAVFQMIEPIFEKTFIFDSYSSRKGKGTHGAVTRLKKLAWKLSRNDTYAVWALQCDIKKFFESVDHATLIELIRRKITDTKTIRLIEIIIRSFSIRKNKGIPLGNLTSQLFSNIYLNPFDHFVKRTLRIKQYLRYADDFVILSRDQLELKNLIEPIKQFLSTHLDLQLHPQKIIVRKWRQGIDFLGYVCFPYYTILRTKTKTRILKKVAYQYIQLHKGLFNERPFTQMVQSYLGVLTHCRGHNIRRQIIKLITS